MKRKTKELDVDFIGEQGNPLTKEEQLAISAFISQLKEKRNDNAPNQNTNRPAKVKRASSKKAIA